jgi:lipid II:glycine glycyltransferase (peptidoglycan interpeptide bridge formation enzyme)
MNSGSGTYSFSDISNENDWDALLARAVFPHMTQAWAFGEAKRRTGWRPRRVAIMQSDEAIAICQILYKSIAGIPVVARINQGPLVLAGHKDKELPMHLSIRRHWRFLWRGPLLISPAIADSTVASKDLAAMGFKRRGTFQWESSRLELARDENEIRKTLEQKWRNRLNKSEKAGLQFTAGNSQEEVTWILDRHTENMSTKGFDGASPSLVRGLYDAAPQDFIVGRVTHAGEPVAGMVMFVFAHVGYFYVGWFGEKGRDLSAGNFLLWNAALELKRRGVKQFDLGGHNGAVAFGKFKMGMNGLGYRTAGEFLSI